jgi:hypothetical protein
MGKHLFSELHSMRILHISLGTGVRMLFSGLVSRQAMKFQDHLVKFVNSL